MTSRLPLWRKPDFLKFWAADTISAFGSLITRAALPFTAILALDATAFQIGLLAVADLLPAFLVGLPVGVWVDRLPRRPILIGSDLGRALLLGTIPLAALLGALTIEHLYVVAFFASILTMFFQVAYFSYLPSLVDKEELLDANSKLSATQSVSEVGAFGASGWLVQLFTGPGAVFIDACSFVVSAVLITRIRVKEAPVRKAEQHESMRREIVEGLRVVTKSGVLSALAASIILMSLTFSVFGTVISLYAIRDLGFNAGVLGMIYGVGGVTSLLGAFAAGPVARRIGIGPAMVVGLVLGGLTMLALPLARDAGIVAAALLVIQQLGDGAITVFAINEISLRQAIAPAGSLGRVNAMMQSSQTGARLLGALTGGILGGIIGLRTTLGIGASGAFLGALWLLASPVRRVRETPAPAAASAPV